MPKCDRCGRSFIAMEELPDKKIDVYIKKVVKRSGFPDTHEWRPVNLCRYCGDDLFKCLNEIP